MLLRNKKTGQEGNFIINKDHFECVDLDYVPSYFSLSELLDEWEDVVPAEPLIKDEKIRKAVRAWASTFGDIRKIAVKYDAVRVSFHFGAVDSSIEFGDDVDIDCEDRQLYTIEELCGEEE